MLDLFKRKQAKPALGLFVFSVKIGRGTNTDMPDPLVGAFVPAYVTSLNHEAAVKAAVTKLVRDGYVFEDIQGPITQLDPEKWTQHVHTAWPEFVSHFPTQSEVAELLKAESVFFGPFAGFERADPAGASGS